MFCVVLYMDVSLIKSTGSSRFHHSTDEVCMYEQLVQCNILACKNVNTKWHEV